MRLLTRPPPAPPAAGELRLALMAAHHAPLVSPPFPAHIDFLRQLLGAGPMFPGALNIGTVLGILGSEDDILADIGRPLAGPAITTGAAPPPDANIDTVRDSTTLNDFRVTPLRRNSTVSTAGGELMVRSTPTTTTRAYIFARLPNGTTVFVIGQYNAHWYAVEQPGRTGFVAARYITLAP